MSGTADPRGGHPHPFGVRFGERIAGSGRLCVGIDPHPWILERWNLRDDAAGARELGLRVVAATAGHAAFVKPQVAFYERHGSAGYAALEEVLAAARDAGLVTIADVKRGDVGSSVEAYAQAWLVPGSPLEADAITVNPYQGFGSLAAVLTLARASGKGVFVLAATSNPEAAASQLAVMRDGPHSGRSVAAGIVADVREWNATGVDDPSDPAATAGVVLGATVSLERYGVHPSELAGSPGTPVLAPGFGHQGAPLAQIDTLFGVAAPQVIAAASRSILQAGPDDLADAIAWHAAELPAPVAR